MSPVLSELLSRAQFAFTVAFHIIFPSISIGLALFLAIMEGIWLKTKNPVYLKICKYWTKIFALTFGMGVVSGIVMAYELGANFPGFTNAIGAVLGPLFGYETLSAFFLEAGFIGIMWFGWDKVSPRVHYLATFLVMLGTLFSVFWILIANSWMQTPAGAEFVHGKFIVTSWWDAINNPSTWPRLTHMVLAAYITGACFVGSVSAYYLLRKVHLDIAKPCFKFAIIALLVLVPLQILLGDTVGLVVHENQPLKTAAIEGVWHTQKGAPLVLFAWPSEKQEKNLYSIEIPYGASIINTHKLEGELIGLTSVAKRDRPPVAPVFFSFRIMVGIGLLLLFAALYGVLSLLKGKLYEARWLQRFMVFTPPLAIFAVWAGWVTAEVGRQPWVVYHFIRTMNAAAHLDWKHVLLSFVSFIIIYGFVFACYIVYMHHLLRNGPQADDVSMFAYMGQGEAPATAIEGEK